MPSPFPGMDPFLEHPAFFPDLHGSMHVYIREALQASLPPPYFAVVKKRLWVETSTRYVEPDTDVIHGSMIGAEREAGGLALAARVQPLVFEVTDDERSESYVEICTRLSEDDERIVTAIEILSLDQKIHFLFRIVKVKAGSGCALHFQITHERLAAMMSGSDGNTGFI